MQFLLFFVRRLFYKTMKSTITPDLVQSATFNAPSKSGSHRQRIAERSENSFIAGWSRSTQHATIRYAYILSFYRIWILNYYTFFYISELRLNTIR